MKTHGHAHPRSGAYKSFLQARRRCRDPKHDSFKSHGAYGIEFRFTSFEQFYAEVGDRPEGQTLDRINSRGHYEPGNVRWANDTVQSENRIFRSKEATTEVHPQ